MMELRSNVSDCDVRQATVNYCTTNTFGERTESAKNHEKWFQTYEIVESQLTDFMKRIGKQILRYVATTVLVLNDSLIR